MYIVYRRIQNQMTRTNLPHAFQVEHDANNGQSSRLITEHKESHEPKTREPHYPIDMIDHPHFSS